MGAATDKVKSVANKAVGSVKEAAGKATDDPSLVAKGKAQQVKGEAQDVSAKVKSKAGDKI